MPKLPIISGLDLVKVLSKRGYKICNMKGSHCSLILGEDMSTIVIIPLHKELKRGTLNSILKKTNISREEFMRLL